MAKHIMLLGICAVILAGALVEAKLEAVNESRESHAMAQPIPAKANAEGNIRLANGVWVNPSLFQCNYGTAYAVSSTVPCENNPLLKVK